MNDLTPAQCAVLDLAVDDYSGLWEVLWRFAALRPELTPTALAELARAEVTELVARDLVRIYSVAPANAPMTLKPGEVQERLSDPLGWHEPARDGVAAPPPRPLPHGARRQPPSIRSLAASAKGGFEISRNSRNTRARRRAVTRSDLQPYLDLLQGLLDGAVTAREFERRYLALFAQDRTTRPRREFLILDRLFVT